MQKLPQEDPEEDEGNLSISNTGGSFQIESSRQKKQLIPTAPKHYQRSHILAISALAILCILVIFLLVHFISGSQILSGSNPGPATPTTDKVYIPSLFLPYKFQVAQSPNTPRGNYRKRILCKILQNKNCATYHIAENVDLFWVIAPIYRFHVQRDEQYLKLHLDFKGDMEAYGLQVMTIEAIRYNNHPEKRDQTEEAFTYAATVPGNEPYDIQVYYYNVTYIRENLLNVGIKKLDKQKPWEYAIWIDGHQFFDNHYWWEETIYKLEKIKSLQLFSRVTKLDLSNKTIVDYYSIMRESLFTSQIDIYSVVYGNAYGILRDVYNQIGYIYDECIATSCDCAYSLASFPEGVGWNLFWAQYYYQNFDGWINDTKKVFNNSRGYVRGNLYHRFHGGLFPYFELQKSVEIFHYNTTTDVQRDANFSLIITNNPLTEDMENIIFKNKKET